MSYDERISHCSRWKLNLTGLFSLEQHGGIRDDQKTFLTRTHSCAVTYHALCNRRRNAQTDNFEVPDVPRPYACAAWGHPIEDDAGQWRYALHRAERHGISDDR